MSQLTDRQVAYLAAAGYMGTDNTRTVMDRTWTSLWHRGLVAMQTVYKETTHKGNVLVTELFLTMRGDAYLANRNPVKTLEIIDRSNAPFSTIKGFAHIYMIRYLPEEALPRFLTHRRAFVRGLAKQRLKHLTSTRG